MEECLNLGIFDSFKKLIEPRPLEMSLAELGINTMRDSSLRERLLTTKEILNELSSADPLKLSPREKAELLDLLLAVSAFPYLDASKEAPVGIMATAWPELKASFFSLCNLDKEDSAFKMSDSELTEQMKEILKNRREKIYKELNHVFLTTVFPAGEMIVNVSYRTEHTAVSSAALITQPVPTIPSGSPKAQELQGKITGLLSPAKGSAPALPQKKGT